MWLMGISLNTVHYFLMGIYLATSEDTSSKKHYSYFPDSEALHAVAKHIRS